MPRRTIIPYRSSLKPISRKLRSQSTLSEVLLWNCLKRKQLRGYQFLRQRPIDQYIVDFFCPELMLAIEIDGDSHNSKVEEDRIRQQRLESLGVRFLRFMDGEIKKNMMGVLQCIEACVGDFERDHCFQHPPTPPEVSGGNNYGREAPENPPSKGDSGGCQTQLTAQHSAEFEVTPSHEIIASGSQLLLQSQRQPLPSPPEVSGGNNKGDFLSRILAHKRKEVHAAKAKTPTMQLEHAVRDLPPTRDFAAALRAGNDLAIIAEMKKASPSAGVLREDFEPEKIAASYAGHGAAALSILTDENFFQGAFENLQKARRVCTLPLLCKDFIIDTHQILSARRHGADAILLIAAALEGPELSCLLQDAHALGMHALVEVHDEKELDFALAQGAKIIGVNNRSLRTFEISLQTSARLMPLIPPACVRVAESGIRHRAEVEYLRDFGIDAILVGTHFMRQPDPGRALPSLQGVARKCFP